MNEDTYFTPPVPLFYPGFAGSKAYRIPSMITTSKGTIIAGIDARIANASDNPNKIETAIRRSTDNGKIWGPVQKLVTYPGKDLDGAAAIDTSLLQDEETGTIWMLFSHTPGGIGLWSSEEGTGFDDRGNRMLFDQDGHVYSMQLDGRVKDCEGKLTAFMVDEEGNVSENGIRRGNIYLKIGADPAESLLEARTSFLQIIRSDDDGLTWSKPIELNPQVKEPWMKFIGSGPGRGIQLKREQYTGRLVFPIYFSNRNGLMSCACIYSDDHGESWERGQSPNDGRIFNKKDVFAETLSETGADLTESQVVEMPDGNLNLYMRNHSGMQRTAVAKSIDGGENWADFRYDHALLDPTCQFTIITYPNLDDGKTRLLFANPADFRDRRNGTVRLSEDGGVTWPYAKVIEDESFSYSCLAVLENGQIALLYESGSDRGNEIKFVKFTLDWIRS